MKHNQHRARSRSTPHAPDHNGNYLDALHVSAEHIAHAAHEALAAAHRALAHAHDLLASLGHTNEHDHNVRSTTKERPAQARS